MKSSPSATSEEFKEALKMLKESLEERKRKDSKGITLLEKVAAETNT